MKNILIILVLILFVLTSIPSNAQFKDWDTKIGLRGNLLFPENEFANFGFGGNNNMSFDWFNFSSLGEAFLGIRATKVLELQLNIGYGIYAGKAYFNDPNISYGEYKTTIIPVNLRFRLNPWDNEKWNPYFYFGGGLMSYDLKTRPSEDLSGVPTNDAGWFGIIPLGIGAEFTLSDNLLLDFSIGGALSTGFDLEGYRSGSDQIWDSYFNIGVGLTLISESCSSDRDNDGLGKCDEEKLGTDPKNPDTDGDGLSDGDEVFDYKTDPLKADTDGDGLSDYDEIMKYNTDPLIADSDGDGLSDGDEVLNHKTDPLKADSDGDDLSDGDEVLYYQTNPLRADTDGDGLSDGGEVINFLTNPLKADTDGDGLSDSDEIMKYETDPNNRDTDAGSVSDFIEVRRGTDPLNSEDDIVRTGVSIVLEGITFATGKTDITPESEIVLQGALETMETNGNIVVEISGHTDDVGSVTTNRVLSQKRADSVRFWLINKGIAPDRIISKGYGEDFPRVPNDSEENRRINRRTEFKRIR
ncbi:MAG TPA: OmpA family protein [Ignavibacteriaceae bacterium]|nr:OmpA family protein [Ignavibacteriaceae bacterium]